MAMTWHLHILHHYCLETFFKTFQIRGIQIFYFCYRSFFTLCVNQQGFGHAWGSKTTSKSPWLKTTKAYFTLLLHIHHAPCGLCSMVFSVRDPTIQSRGWQTFSVKDHVLGFAGQMNSVTATEPWRCNAQTATDNKTLFIKTGSVPTLW